MILSVANKLVVSVCVCCRRIVCDQQFCWICVDVWTAEVVRYMWVVWRTRICTKKINRHTFLIISTNLNYKLFWTDPSSYGPISIVLSCPQHIPMSNSKNTFSYLSHWFPRHKSFLKIFFWQSLFTKTNWNFKFQIARFTTSPNFKFEKLQHRFPFCS